MRRVPAGPSTDGAQRAVQSFGRALGKWLGGLSLLWLVGPHCASADAPIDIEPGLAPVGAVEFGGSLELIREALKHTALGQRPGDDVRTSKQELQLQLSYHASERLSALGEIKWQAERQTHADATPRLVEQDVERGESWLHWRRLFDDDISIKIGRQNFVEPRRWWWDDDLDALRFDYARDSWRFTLGLAEAFARKSSQENFIDPRDEDVLRWLGHAHWKLSSAWQFSAFYLRQRDDSPRHAIDSLVPTARADASDAALQWLGLRAAGDVTLSHGGTLGYWVDTATVTGDETVFEYRTEDGGTSRVVSSREQRVRGYAVDAGLVWKPSATRGPTLALSHARGSGDSDLGDGVDHAFRQTGLHDPTQEFRTYGELLRPELSNLSATTATMGFAVHRASRVTLGYHRFRQAYPAAFLRDARINLLPTGQDRDIGREISLLLEIGEWETLRAVLAVADFKAGPAFGAAAGEHARSAFLEFTFEF